MLKRYWQKFINIIQKKIAFKGVLRDFECFMKALKPLAREIDRRKDSYFIRGHFGFNLWQNIWSSEPARCDHCIKSQD